MPACCDLEAPDNSPIAVQITLHMDPVHMDRQEMSTRIAEHDQHLKQDLYNAYYDKL